MSLLLNFHIFFHYAHKQQAKMVLTIPNILLFIESRGIFIL